MFPSQWAKFCYLKESYKMIYTGGYYSRSNEFSKETYVVELDTNVISKKADMLGPRSNHGICRIKDTIYCAGGNSKTEILNSTEIYDVVHNSWRQGPDLNKRKFGLTLVSTDDRFIYSFGQLSEE